MSCHNIIQYSMKYHMKIMFLITLCNCCTRKGKWHCYSGLIMLSPYNLSRDTGTCNSIWLDDPSFRDDFLIDTSSHRYSGAISLIDLEVINKILKWICCLTGSQCSFWRIGVIWSYFLVFVTMQDALFWIRWRRLML